MVLFTTAFVGSNFQLVQYIRVSRASGRVGSGTVGWIELSGGGNKGPERRAVQERA
jgi:hypothetical protein